MDILSAVARWLGLLAHLPMLLVFIVQGLNVPTEGVLFLVGLWLALLGVIAFLWRRAPLLIPMVPVLDVLIVFGVTAAGRALFDWQG